MNILIEDAETLQFLTGNGRWTKKPGDGASFATIHDAFTAAKKEPIHKFNIVRYFSGTEQFINMDHGSGKGKETASA
jgi:hypothetical protein